MENRVSLSQYFGSDEAAGVRFFDELGSAATPVDLMTQSVNLQEGDGETQATANLFTNETTTAFSQAPSDLTFTTMPPTVVSSSTALPAANLPDPSTFFDTIAPEMQIAPGKVAPRASGDFLSQSLEGLSIKAQAAPVGSFFPEREVLTMPGIILEEELADHLQETAVRLLGVGEAASRGVLRAEHVSRDEAGLRELIRTGYLRAAVTLTGTLISAAGQGVVGLGRPTKHTQRSLQLWLTRLSLMARLRLREPLRREAEAFGDLGKPDMFYQFYPETYGGRAGSLVPFSLRLLIAELPLYTGDPHTALHRLYALLAVVRQMLRNLRAGKTEDGSGTVAEPDRAESVRLWSGRETRVLHSVVNCAVTLKDFRLAIETTSRLAEGAQSDAHSRALLSALCRLCLQAGHVRSAEEYLSSARRVRHRLCPTPDVREYVDQGLLEVAQGRYQEAYNCFARAAEQEPTNVMVANNSSVCLLYMGRLKEAIGVLQKAIAADPERGLCESLLLNLCTLYELESSETLDKKLALLRTLCKFKSDTLPNVPECLKLA